MQQYAPTEGREREKTAVLRRVKLTLPGVESPAVGLGFGRFARVWAQIFPAPHKVWLQAAAKARQRRAKRPRAACQDTARKPECTVATNRLGACPSLRSCRGAVKSGPSAHTSASSEPRHLARWAYRAHRAQEGETARRGLFSCLRARCSTAGRHLDRRRTGMGVNRRRQAGARQAACMRRP